MRIGIVGSEQAKFNLVTELIARDLVFKLVADADLVISGECHLGGIDIYAKECALALEIPYQGFPPKKLAWEGGYKQRNVQIASNSDVVHCITVEKLPTNYSGMTFKRCYHCDSDDHIKSGGCWTAIKAKKLGREAWLHVIQEDGGVRTRAY